MTVLKSKDIEIKNAVSQKLSPHLLKGKEQSLQIIINKFANIYRIQLLSRQMKQHVDPKLKPWHVLKYHFLQLISQQTLLPKN